MYYIYRVIPQYSARDWFQDLPGSPNFEDAQVPYIK